MTTLTHVRLNHPLFRGPLQLIRVPKYLRFVWRKNTNGQGRPWDALDLPGDEPDAEEYMIAGILRSRSTVHLDRTVDGRRIGEWRETATYDMLEPQPPQEVMRDTERWQAWCMDREKAV